MADRGKGRGTPRTPGGGRPDGRGENVSRLPTRVLLADNHTMFRRAIMALLQKDGEVRVVGDADRGEAAVRLARNLEPDVVIMQVDEELEEARDEIRRILEATPPTPRFVILSMYDDPAFVRGTLEMGVSAYVHKSGTLDDLLSAVRSLAGGERSHGQAVVALPERVVAQVQDAADSGLSARQIELVVWVARGLTNRQIAARLHLAEATVTRHLANVYQRLGAGSRSEAVARGLSEGWITRADIIRSE